jgi:hypothetical protein
MSTCSTAPTARWLATIGWAIIGSAIPCPVIGSGIIVALEKTNAAKQALRIDQKPMPVAAL